MEKSSTTHCETKINCNSDIKRGVVILSGQMMEDEEWYKVFTDVESMINNNANHNILYICFNKRYISLEELENYISDFSDKNPEQLSIISLMHGNEILPFEAHRTLFYPLVNLDGYIDSIPSLVASYLNGRFIKTIELVRVFAQAVGNRPIELLICSCQGNKVISEDAQAILPKGSSIIALSKGAVTMPGLVINAIEKALNTENFSISTVIRKLPDMHEYNKKAYYQFIQDHKNWADPNMTPKQNFETFENTKGIEMYYFDPEIASNGKIVSLVECADKLLKKHREYLNKNPEAEFADDTKTYEISQGFCKSLESYNDCMNSIRSVFNIAKQAPNFRVSDCVTRDSSSKPYVLRYISPKEEKRHMMCKIQLEEDPELIFFIKGKDYLTVLGAAEYYRSISDDSLYSSDSDLVLLGLLEAIA